MDTKYKLFDISKEDEKHMVALNKFFRKKKKNDLLNILYKKSKKKID